MAKCEQFIGFTIYQKKKKDFNPNISNLNYVAEQCLVREA